MKQFILFLMVLFCASCNESTNPVVAQAPVSNVSLCDTFKWPDSAKTILPWTYVTNGVTYTLRANLLNCEDAQNIILELRKELLKIKPTSYSQCQFLYRDSLNRDYVICDYDTALDAYNARLTYYNLIVKKYKESRTQYLKVANWCEECAGHDMIEYFAYDTVPYKTPADTIQRPHLLE